MRPIGEPLELEQLLGPTRPINLFGFLKGNPERSGGAAGVPSPAPPAAAITGRMSRTPDKDGNTPRPVSADPGQRLDRSTTWAWRKVKIRPAPTEASKKIGAAGRWYRTARRNPRESLTITVSYRGGPEAWYQIRARGSIGRFHGATALHDVMSEINEGETYWSDKRKH